MVDIMEVVYGMLDHRDKINLMNCSSTNFRLGVQAGRLRRNQDELWLSDWARPRLISEVSPQ